MHKARALANVYFWNKWYLHSGEQYVFTNNVPKEWAMEILDEAEIQMLNDLQKMAENNAVENID
jgi:hypothetical protein